MCTFLLKWTKKKITAPLMKLRLCDGVMPDLVMADDKAGHYIDRHDYMPRQRECRYPHYETYEARLRTYKHWPLHLQPAKEELAGAGFFYTGVGDRTQCFFCGGGLKDWEPQANPWDQHARWYDCAFVLQMQGNDYVRRIVKRWWGSEIAHGSAGSAKPTRNNYCCPCHNAHNNNEIRECNKSA